MIENFNGIFNLILNILILLLFAVYTFRILFAPAGIAKEFNVDKSGIFIIRYLGCFALSALLLGLWILFRPMGPTGTWPYYNFIFLTALFNLIYDLSLKWILSHPEVTVVIPGAKNKIQAELNVKASELNEINSIKDSIKEIYNKYFKKDIHSNW